MKAVSQYLLAAVAALGMGTGLVGCGSGADDTSVAPAGRKVAVVAVERVYGDLARQIGGKDVVVTTILNSPSADPHAYEPTTRDADAIGAADIVIENGLGYDAFADKVIAATPRRRRIVIDVGAERHHIGDNPHVWYDMPTLRLFTNAFALALAEHLDKATGDAEGPALVTRALAIQSWANATQHRLALLGAKHRGALVAITEPVFDYVLDAAAVKIATPPSFSHAIEEGNDPAPQDVDAMQAMLAHKSVAAFVYNTQTVEPATQRLLATAKAANVAVVPVTETLPQNLTTQHWIDGEIDALDRAL